MEAKLAVQEQALEEASQEKRQLEDELSTQEHALEQSSQEKRELEDQIEQHKKDGANIRRLEEEFLFKDKELHDEKTERQKLEKKVAQQTATLSQLQTKIADLQSANSDPQETGSTDPHKSLQQQAKKIVFVATPKVSQMLEVLRTVPNMPKFECLDHISAYQRVDKLKAEEALICAVAQQTMTRMEARVFEPLKTVQDTFGKEHTYAALLYWKETPTGDIDEAIRCCSEGTTQNGFTCPKLKFIDSSGRERLHVTYGFLKISARLQYSLADPSQFVKDLLKMFNQ